MKAQNQNYQIAKSNFSASASCTIINKITGSYTTAKNLNYSLNTIAFLNDDVTVRIKKDPVAVNDNYVIVVVIEKKGETMQNYLDTQNKLQNNQDKN